MHMEIAMAHGSMTAELWEKKLKPFLKAQKEVHQMKGTPPAGDLEKQLQRWLTDQGHSSGSKD